jgi:hypothetical protein
MFCCCKRAARPGFLHGLIRRLFVSGTSSLLQAMPVLPSKSIIPYYPELYAKIFQIFCCCKPRAFPERQRGAHLTAPRCCLLIMDLRMGTLRLGMGNEAENSLLRAALLVRYLDSIIHNQTYTPGREVLSVFSTLKNCLPTIFKSFKYYNFKTL